MRHCRVSGSYSRRVWAFRCWLLSALHTSNSSKFELLSRSFLWFEIPSYSIHWLEPTRRSGRRRTCAFQFPMMKSKSWLPSWSGTVSANRLVESIDRVSKASRIQFITPPSGFRVGRILENHQTPPKNHNHRTEQASDSVNPPQLVGIAHDV